MKALLKRIAAWLIACQEPQRRKTTQELEGDVLLAQMRRCGIRVLMYGRADPADDYPYHGPGWFFGTNTTGDGVGFYIRDVDAAAAIMALYRTKSGDREGATRALKAICAEEAAEPKQ